MGETFWGAVGAKHLGDNLSTPDPVYTCPNAMLLRTMLRFPPDPLAAE
ncbi:MAG: hypothetical protein F6K31_09330 [Symploca sp. SIO2G7]|nr:hypothetical protein [Symploca sp. SIO2G7]